MDYQDIIIYNFIYLSQKNGYISKEELDSLKDDLLLHLSVHRINCSAFNIELRIINFFMKGILKKEGNYYKFDTQFFGPISEDLLYAIFHREAAETCIYLYLVKKSLHKENPKFTYKELTKNIFKSPKRTGRIDFLIDEDLRHLQQEHFILELIPESNYYTINTSTPIYKFKLQK